MPSKPIRINVDSVPINLEPPLLTDSMSSWVLHHVADRLVEEHRPGQIQGNLAARWTVSSDKTQYCFKIASGRKFQDGSSLTGRDVSESLKMAKGYSDKSRIGFYLQNIKSVDTKGSDEVCVQLKQPSANFLQILSDASFSIYKKESGKLVFSGAYSVGEASKAYIEIVRRLDGQSFHLVAMDFSNAFEKFRAGDLEILKNSGTGGLREILELKGQKLMMPDERTFFLAFNLRSKYFSNVANRRSFTSSLKWSALENSAKQLGLSLSGSLLSPTLMRESPKFSYEEKAMPKASIPKFTVLTQKGFDLKDNVKALFAGKVYTHKDLDKALFLKALYSADFDVLYTGYGITVRDWDYLSTLFHSSSSHNMVFLKDSEIDEMLSRARELSSPVQRLDLYQSILKKNNQHIWYVPVTHTPLVFAFSSHLKIGSEANSSITTPWFRFDEVKWINKK